MVYVPDNTYACYVVQSEGVIRAYEQIPTYNTTISYRDYYVNSHYLYRDGTANVSSYGILPVCLDSSNITTDFYYRNDLDSILIIFLILCIFCIYIPLKIFSKLFKKGGL